MTLRRMVEPLVRGCLILTLGCQYVSGANELEIVTPTARVEPDWSCLGQMSAPLVPRTISYQGIVRNITGTRTVNNVVVRLCESTDEPCSSPILRAETTNGSLAFSVDASFAGYIELESPEMMPAIVELSRPLGAMSELPEFRMLDRFTLDVFAGNMGATVNPAYGHALFWAVDCAGRHSPDVTVSALGTLTPETGQYYVVDQKLPSATLNKTDASGGGGFINLPTTYVTFEARRAGTDQLISTFSARIRAGQVTFTIIEPD